MMLKTEATLVTRFKWKLEKVILSKVGFSTRIKQRKKLKKLLKNSKKTIKISNESQELNNKLN